MTTRIKYTRSGKNYTSNYILNFEGKRFIVFIHHNAQYTLSIVNEAGDVVYQSTTETSNKAKRIARKYLINNLGVNLIDEVRIK